MNLMLKTLNKVLENIIAVLKNLDKCLTLSSKLVKKLYGWYSSFDQYMHSESEDLGGKPGSYYNSYGVIQRPVDTIEKWYMHSLALAAFACLLICGSGILFLLNQNQGGNALPIIYCILLSFGAWKLFTITSKRANLLGEKLLR